MTADTFLGTGVRSITVPLRPRGPGWREIAGAQQFTRSGAATDRVGTLEDRHVESGLRESDRRCQPVRAGADNDRSAHR